MIVFDEHWIFYKTNLAHDLASLVSTDRLPVTSNAVLMSYSRHTGDVVSYQSSIRYLRQLVYCNIFKLEIHYKLFLCPPTEFYFGKSSKVDLVDTEFFTNVDNRLNIIGNLASSTQKAFSFEMPLFGGIIESLSWELMVVLH